MGKKRFMAQGLPVEVFADKKIKKWVARSKEKGIRLAEAVGVSPVEEMMFFWNGYRRMDQENFQKSLQALQYRGDEEMEDEAIDEQAIRWLLLSAVMRNAGQWEEARGYLEKIEEVDRTQFRGALVNDYMSAFPSRPTILSQVTNTKQCPRHTTNARLESGKRPRSTRWEC